MAVRAATETIAERLIDRRSSVGQVAVSPDGTRVAFVVATTDLGENTTRTKVWLDDGPVTSGDHDGSPTWSPDGRWLAFTSRRGEKKGDSTLHVLPVATAGEVRTVCTMPDGLGDVTWSPDGRWLAFTSRSPRCPVRGEGRVVAGAAQGRAVLQPAERRGLDLRSAEPRVRRRRRRHRDAARSHARRVPARRHQLAARLDRCRHRPASATTPGTATWPTTSTS